MRDCKRIQLHDFTVLEIGNKQADRLIVSKYHQACVDSPDGLSFVGCICLTVVLRSKWKQDYRVNGPKTSPYQR